MLILGIDPGLDRTGYAVLQSRPDNIIDAGLIRSAASTPLAERLAEISRGLDEVLDEHPVGLMAVENLYAHYKHPRTAILMGHARGVVLLAAARRGIEVLSLPATQVKKALSGNGHASKLQMQRAVAAQLNLKTLPDPPDVADALAIALAGALQTRGGGRSTRPSATVRAFHV